MDNTLAFWQEHILSLNSRLINSEITLDDYRKSIAALFSGIDRQTRIQLDNIVFA